MLVVVTETVVAEVVVLGVVGELLWLCWLVGGVLGSVVQLRVVWPVVSCGQHRRPWVERRRPPLSRLRHVWVWFQLVVAAVVPFGCGLWGSFGALEVGVVLCECVVFVVVSDFEFVGSLPVWAVVVRLCPCECG